MYNRKVEPKRPSIYDFLSYREFLAAMIKYLKKRERLTVRAFAKRAGLASSGYLSMVISGQRELSPKAALKFAKALKLRAQETDFFKGLVRLQQASSSEEKSKVLDELVQFRSFESKRNIEAHQYHFFSNWLTPILYEALVQPQTKASLLTMAEALGLSKADLNSSLSTMEELKLVQLEKGKYLRTSHMLETISTLAPVSIYNFHRDVIQASLRALDSVPQAERQYESLTISVSLEERQKIKKKLFEFVQSLNEEFSQSTHPEKIYQLNLSFFPVADLPKGD